MAEEKTTKQVNVNFKKDPELLKILDLMVQEEESDRSKFIRRLIRREAMLREHLPFPNGSGKQNRRRATAA